MNAQYADENLLLIARWAYTRCVTKKRDGEIKTLLVLVQFLSLGPVSVCQFPLLDFVLRDGFPIPDPTEVCATVNVEIRRIEFPPRVFRGPVVLRKRVMIVVEPFSHSQEGCLNQKRHSLHTELESTVL